MWLEIKALQRLRVVIKPTLDDDSLSEDTSRRPTSREAHVFDVILAASRIHVGYGV